MQIKHISYLRKMMLYILIICMTVCRLTPLESTYAFEGEPIEVNELFI